MPLRNILLQMTRMLWPLGFGRRSEPPTGLVSRSEQPLGGDDAEETHPRSTEIPPEQHPGGGPPRR